MRLHDTAQQNYVRPPKLRILHITTGTVRHSAIWRNIVQPSVGECHTGQHSAIRRNTVQYSAIRHFTLQYGTSHCNTVQPSAKRHFILQYGTSHCNTVQPTNPMQYGTSHCNIVQYSAIRQLILEYGTSNCNIVQHSVAECHTGQYNIVQYSATPLSQCNPFLLVPFRINFGQNQAYTVGSVHYTDYRCYVGYSSIVVTCSLHHITREPTATQYTHYKLN